MNIKTFKGFEEIYPEKVDGTDSWYFGQWTPCSEAYEVPKFKNKYPGTRLYFIEYPSGKVFEPINQEANVFLERPVYEYKDNSCHPDKRRVIRCKEDAERHQAAGEEDTGCIRKEKMLERWETSAGNSAVAKAGQ